MIRLSLHPSDRLGGTESGDLLLLHPHGGQAGVQALLVGERERLADGELGPTLGNHEPHHHLDLLHLVFTVFGHLPDFLDSQLTFNCYSRELKKAKSQIGARGLKKLSEMCMN